MRRSRNRVRTHSKTDPKVGQCNPKRKYVTASPAPTPQETLKLAGGNKNLPNFFRITQRANIARRERSGAQINKREIAG